MAFGWIKDKGRHITVSLHPAYAAALGESIDSDKIRYPSPAAGVQRVRLKPTWARPWMIWIAPKTSSLPSDKAKGPRPRVIPRSTNETVLLLGNPMRDDDRDELRARYPVHVNPQRPKLDWARTAFIVVGCALGLAFWYAIYSAVRDLL